VGSVNLFLSATCAEGAPQEPLLYLRLYFKHNRQSDAGIDTVGGPASGASDGVVGQGNDMQDG